MADAPAGGNLLTRKIGPLPGYGWLAIAAVLGYLYFKHKQAAAPASTDTSGSLPTGSSTAPPLYYSSPDFSPPISTTTTETDSGVGATVSPGWPVTGVGQMPGPVTIGGLPPVLFSNPVTAPASTLPGTTIHTTTNGTPVGVTTLPVIGPSSAR